MLNSIEDRSMFILGYLEDSNAAAHSVDTGISYRENSWGSCFSAHSWTNSFSSSLVHRSWAFLFSEDVRREEVWDDSGIEPSSTNGKDSDEPELAVEGDGLGVPRSLKL